MTTNIVISGQTFLAGKGSKDMPPAAREQLAQLLGSLEDKNGNGIPDILEQGGDAVVQAASQFVINGRRYGSLEEMPPADRKLYDLMRTTLLNQPSLGSSAPLVTGPQSVGQPQGDLLWHQPANPAPQTFANEGGSGSDLSWLGAFFLLLVGVLIGLAVAISMWFALK